jgi:hypothetical protein
MAHECQCCGEECDCIEGDVLPRNCIGCSYDCGVAIDEEEPEE